LPSTTTAHGRPPLSREKCSSAPVGCRADLRPARLE
jgi:hypothetical protein